MANTENFNSLLYSPDDGASDVQVVMQDDTAWVTQKGMAELFDIDVSGITKHLKNIYETNELEENSTCATFAHVGETGQEYPTKYYNLDAVISVGYRVNSQKATQFRIWASNIIKQYIKDGYVINEALLRENPEKLSKLAAKLRELRSNEKNVFASVREVFKLASSDYEPSSMLVRSFYAKLQDKFHHAITSMTASKLIIDRAEHSDSDMGITHKKGELPTLKEAKIGKNYLREDELYRMHLLSEQFLLFAETTALRGQSMTMQQLHDQLDKLLELNGYPVFSGYDDFHLKDRAMEHAEREFNQFLEIKKLEHLKVNVDLELFYEGEYDDYKHETSKIRIQDINKQLKTEKDALKIEQQDDEELSGFNKTLKTALGFNPKDR